MYPCDLNDQGSVHSYCYSIFFEKDAFFCEPEDLGSKENGGVAVLKGKKVTRWLMRKTTWIFIPGIKTSVYLLILPFLIIRL